MRYGNGAYINYLYDDKGRVKYKYYNGNSNNRIEYYYNASGNLGVVVDYITNETTRYIYDLSSRLVEVEVFGTASLTDTTVVKSIKYTYADKTNYLTEVEYDSPLGTQTYNYNYGNMADGEMPDAVYSVGYNGTTQLEYTYDAFGRLTERKLSPINKSQTFTYKQGGYGENSTSTLVKTVTANGVTYEYVYDANGNIIEIYYDGILLEYFEYDSQNQLTEYGDFFGPLVNYEYSNGNIISVTDGGEITKTFSYTDENWPDKLTAFNGNAITYDAIGNPLTYHDGKVFTWTNGRQLSTITKGSNYYAYTYNADGLRTSKTVHGTTTQFIYADGVLLGQKTGNDILLFLYDESGGKFGFIYNGAYYYYDINLQGDVVGVYDSNGTKVVIYEYNNWGDLTGLGGSLRETIGHINPIRYRGYYYDNETGFYYLQSRYYDPNICRFINADGYVSTGQGVLGYNMFAYCNNNPVMRCDPTGELSWKDIRNWASNVWDKATSFVTNTFGVGIVQAQEYKAMQLTTSIVGLESGVSTSKVMAGDISKPISFYVENASKWWKLNEYKVGTQINIAGGGVCYSGSLLENTMTFSGKNSSVEFVSGINKIGFTHRSGVDFKKRTAETYSHAYIRSVPFVFATVAVAVAWPYIVASSPITVPAAGLFFALSQ